MPEARIPYDACPLCAHSEADEVGVAPCSAHPLWRKGLPETMRWLRCTACAHVFTDGWFSDAALALVLSGANDAQLLDPAQAGAHRRIAARIVERVVALRGGPAGVWLDVGFGNGALLATAGEFGFEAVGLDLRREAVERMRAFGFEAHRATLEAFEPGRLASVISFADVLEHMPFPRTALARAHALLEPGGVLFVSMPNLDCFHWKALDAANANPYWGELEHLHNFGRARLHALLAEHGFEPAGYAVSERYVAGMEILARRLDAVPRAA